MMFVELPPSFSLLYPRAKRVVFDLNAMLSMTPVVIFLKSSCVQTATSFLQLRAQIVRGSHVLTLHSV